MSKLVDSTAPYMYHITDIHTEAGELRGRILGPSAVLDSPLLNLELTPFSYIVMRVQYYGIPVRALLQLMMGPADTAQPQYLIPWTARQALQVIDDSGHVGNAISSNAVDGDLYSFWETNLTTGAYIILDLGGDRSINEIRVLTFSDTSPKRCLLQISSTSGVGPFRTVASFTLLNDTIGFQSITGIEIGYARYWKLFVLDNYGGATTQIFEVEVFGVDNSISNIPLAIANDGNFHIIYVPVNQYAVGGLTRVRISLSYPGGSAFVYSPSSQFIAIDYIRFLRSPDIWRVRGCLDKYYSSKNLGDAVYNVTTVVERINDHLSLHSFIKNAMRLPYATTYDCPLVGGIPIQIEGYNFGSGASVFIGGEMCPISSHFVSSTDGRLEAIVCMLPPGSPGEALVEVQNGLHPQITQQLSYLAYSVPAPRMDPPQVSNVASTKVDLSWSPPGSVFDQMTVTGYAIECEVLTVSGSSTITMTVGNVTQTSVRGLSPNTSYTFSIAAVSEMTYPLTAANLPTDLYGRRTLLPGASIGVFSQASNSTLTLLNDIAFSAFDVNSTLNHSATSFPNTLGPTGNFGGEGSYGLYLVGFANLENCNASTTCCDGFNSSLSALSCRANISVCSVSLSNRFNYLQETIPLNVGLNGSTPSINMQSLEEFMLSGGSYPPTTACGTVIRLTSSGPRQAGAMWYRRKQNVAEGFDVYFSFLISNPSQECLRMDDVNTYCRSRGADGLAFVIQNSNPYALGADGSALGYGGISNGLAVEFDTFYNYDRLDYYENHISIITRVLESKFIHSMV